jgi:beta-lactamase regulating signal transducer with metallopeptidase domain
MTVTQQQDLPSDAGYIVLPRYLSLTIASALVLWIFGGVWYAAKLDSRVASLELQTRAMQSAAESRVNERDRLTIVEQQVIAIRQMQEAQSRVLERIERRLERSYSDPTVFPQP